MKTTPILFNTEMVRALLDGRKTQTRRQVKLPFSSQYTNYCGLTHDLGYPASRGNVWAGFGRTEDPVYFKFPYGQPGDLIYVRETCRAEELPIGLDGVRFKADSDFKPIHNSMEASDDWGDLYHYKGKKGATVPNIHMPRWASRLTLKINDVRVERVQSITNESAIKEGVLRISDPSIKVDWVKGFAIACFAKLWDSIYSNWDDNPFVWVVEFEVIKMNIDEYLKQNGG